MKDMVICRCEEVSYRTILSAIQDGAATSKEIKLWTRAGMGICQGRTCRPLIDTLAASHTGQSMPERSTLTHQYPVRPLQISDLCLPSKGRSL